MAVIVGIKAISGVCNYKAKINDECPKTKVGTKL